MRDEILKSYRLLELEPGSSLELVRAAWREQVKVWHPDRFSNDPKLQPKAHQRLQEINNAYEILQAFLVSGTPKQNGTAASSSSEAQHQQTKANKEAPPPQTARPSPKAAPKTETVKTDFRSIFLLICAMVVILGIILGQNERKPVAQIVSQPAVAFVPPVSKKLDEKNGFKDFKLGMSSNEAREILTPTVAYNPELGTTRFSYVGTTANRIGDLSINGVTLSFFEDHLYRIELGFTESGNQILEAFKVNFGETFENGNWTAGEQKLRDKSWRGEKVAAAILSTPGKDWDSLIIYNIELESKAQNYASKEPERAAADIGPAGFKSLTLGMKIEDVKLKYVLTSDDQINGTKSVSFPLNPKNDDFATVGQYPLSSVTAVFFQEKLFRIDLNFNSHQQKLFETFQKRFGQLADNDTWTRGSVKLAAKEARAGDISAFILGSRASIGKTESWESIILFSTSIWTEAEQYKLVAPKRLTERAAKDI